MVPDSLEIAQFDPADAEELVELFSVVHPVWVNTAASILQTARNTPARARRQAWVGRSNGRVVGHATAMLSWFGDDPAKGRIWVGVLPGERGRGVGSALWELAVAHLSDAKKLTVEVDDDADGVRFAERRGFAPYDSELMLALDPAAASVEARELEGFRVAPLAEVSDRDRELFDFYGAAGGIPPGSPVAYGEWRAVIFEGPLLDRDGSVVVLDGDDRIVSLSWLLVDHGKRRAENEWTATLPHLRGRGLARIAKEATIRWAEANGIRELVTGNHADNLPMLELNRRLGYRELFVRRDLELRL